MIVGPHGQTDGIEVVLPDPEPDEAVTMPPA